MNYSSKTRQRKFLPNQRGFSIIELLLVLVFMTAIISGIIPLLTRAIAANKNNKNKLLSYQAANAEIEDMRNTNFDTLADYTFNVSGVSQATGNVDISDVIDGQVETDIVVATVTVSWPYKNKTENVELVTYIARYGID